MKCRFAPSPTGNIHIGNARSAILNWVFCKQNKGEFVLRIDDTDFERSKKGYEEFIKKDLTWLGINWSKVFNQSDSVKAVGNIILESIRGFKLHTHEIILYNDSKGKSTGGLCRHRT